MKKHILYSAAIVFTASVIAAALAWPRHPVQSPIGGSEQLKQLQNRIGQLETKSAALQKELDQIRKQPQTQTPTVFYRPAGDVIPSVTTIPTPEQIPPGWKPFEFNGTTYYFTPLGQRTEVSMAQTRQTEAAVTEPFQQAK